MELKIDRLCRFYGSNKALEDFSYTLKPGVYGLLGPNGAGKSTLINVITDNLKPTSGELLFNGTPISDLKEEYRREIGFVPQQQQMFPGFTLRRFLYYMAGLKGLKKEEADIQMERARSLRCAGHHIPCRLGHEPDGFGLCIAGNIH